MGIFMDSLEAVLDNALEIGRRLLENGAETQRAEDTVARICTAGGAASVEVFAITSVIYATARDSRGVCYTQLKRIGACSTNLYAIEKLNALSRRICAQKLSADEINADIAALSGSDMPYSDVYRYIGAALAASAFCMFFGGALRDALCAGGAGCVIIAADKYKPPRLNRIAHTVFTSLLGGVLALLSARIGTGGNAGKIMIGTVMLLIPGAAIGVSMRDMLLGDMISGILRFVHSLLAACAIAAGFAAAIMIFGSGGALH